MMQICQVDACRFNAMQSHQVEVHMQVHQVKIVHAHTVT